MRRLREHLTTTSVFSSSNGLANNHTLPRILICSGNEIQQWMQYSLITQSLAYAMITCESDSDPKAETGSGNCLCKSRKDNIAQLIAYFESDSTVSAIQTV